MTCPACKSEGAYVGLDDVECPNRDCRHFSAKVEPKRTYSYDVKVLINGNLLVPFDLTIN